MCTRKKKNSLWVTLEIRIMEVKMKNTFYKIVILTVLLSGCARKADPITEINDGIQHSASELVDYAQNNMTMDTDKQLLLQGVKDCAARADAMTKAYTAKMDQCESEKSKLRLERNGLFGILLVLIGLMVYKPVRKLFGL